MCVCVCVPVHLGDTHCTCFPKYGFLWTHLPLKCFTFSQHKQNRKWEDPALPYPYGKCGKQGSDSLSFSDHHQRLMCVREIDTILHTHTHTHKHYFDKFWWLWHFFLFFPRINFYELHSMFFLISIKFTKRNKKTCLYISPCKSFRVLLLRHIA